MSRISTALVLLLAASPVAGQTLTLPRDIATGPESSAGSSPDQLTLVRDKVVFRAVEPGTGTEIWGSDGTPTGTELLRDACPGPCTDNPEILGGLNGAVLWATFPQRSASPELWRTDGTRAGTSLLASGISADRARLGTGFVFFQGALYFNRCEPVSPDRCEIWRTDGTAEGTGPALTGIDGADLYVAGDRLFLLDYDGNYRLWVSDGTSAGTSLVDEDIPLADPAFVAVAGNRLFFISHEDGGELWVSDGTAAGTRALTDFQPESPFRGFIKASGSRVWVIANDVLHGDELWVSDGTPEGTRRATDFPVYHPFDETAPIHLAEVGGRLVFRATDGLSGPQLWVTDGSPESTARVRDLTVGPGPLIAAGGRVFFAGGDEQGTEVWVTDGTPNGTRMVRDVCPGCDAEAMLLQASGGGALFVARSPSRGFEIWQTDGTEAGTRPLTDMPEGRPGTVPVARTPGGGVLYFQGADGHGDELWRADGEGTRLVADITRRPPGSLPRDVTAVGDRLFFTACEALERQIWWTGGAPGSTGSAPILQGDDTCNNSSYALHYFTPAGNLLYFSRWNQGSQLWRTDGTLAGTVQLTQAPGQMSGFFDDPDMVGFRGSLYFLWNNDDDRAELWKSDGTPGGTARVVSLGGSYGAGGLTAAGQELYFWAYRPQGDAVVELWRSNGTPAGTRTIASNLKGPFNFHRDFVRAGSYVYFYAMRDLREGLWRTDGTAAGTTQVIEELPFDAWNLVEHQGDIYFLAGTNGFLRLWKVDGDSGAVTVVREIRSDHHLEDARFRLAVFAGRLFFQANDGIHGLELWSSDGTAEGTRLFRDIFPGPESSRPSGLTVAGNRLFFTAHDGVHGTELWQTDGTEGGTRMVQDLFPGPSSVPPSWLTATPSHLYLVADDGLSGEEIWALPLAGQGCQPSPERLCLEDGRFQVEAAWRDFQGNTGRGQAVPLTPDTGWFWFFGPENVETVLKVLDGRGLNGHRWVFYGALSSVEYHLTVTDTQTGASRRYFNPSGQLASVGDTRAFGPLGAAVSALVAPPSPLALTSVRVDPAAAASTCAPASNRLCLNGDRFAVTASWKDFQGKTGAGTAVEMTGDTGYFWFFNPENVEVVLKVLDGTPLNGHHWVFYGALSNVEYTLEVTDTATGTIRTYRNPSGRFASVADTGAF